MVLREDRSAPHPLVSLPKPRNHAEILERIRCADSNDPPGAPESRLGAGERPAPASLSGVVAALARDGSPGEASPGNGFLRDCPLRGAFPGDGPWGAAEAAVDEDRIAPIRPG